MGNFDLIECLRESQQQGIVITRDGQPLAIDLGVEGLDMEQVEYGQSSEFWQLIGQRRSQPTMSHAELEARITE